MIVLPAFPPVCRPVPPPRLRPWQGFGHGCNVQEHVNYGACLDGRCCTRHSVERRNALRVVQFLGGRQRGQGQGRGGTVHGTAAEADAARNGSSAPNSPSVQRPDASVASCSSADSGTAGGASSASAENGRAGSPGVSCAGRTQSAGGKRTPLHFASERGELALVDR